MNNFDPQSQARFMKVLVLMEQAATVGEKSAARAAATRMASSVGLTLEEAIEVIRTGSSRKERVEELRARRKAERRWSRDESFASPSRQRARKEAWQRAFDEAMKGNNQPRDFSNQDFSDHNFSEPVPSNIKRQSGFIPRYRPSYYRPTADDRFRLISGLLRDGASIVTTMSLAEASREEVVKVWLLVRNERRPNYTKNYTKGGYTRNAQVKTRRPAF